MEHIKQQIEALRTQADLLANVLTPNNISIVATTLKISNVGDSSNFTDTEAAEIRTLLIDIGFRKSANANYSDGVHGEYYYFGGYDFCVWFYVKESTETEIDRLRKRLVELEGGERA